MNFKTYTEYVSDNINKIEENQISNLINLLYTAFQDEKMVFVIGNGGSAASASHLAQDLAKGTKYDINQRKRLKALSLTDNIPFITATGNDESYENIFVQQLVTFAKEGDLLIAISGSGNSPNIVKAVEWANQNGMVTIGITGFDGGALHKMNHHSVHIPLNDMCTTESLHTFIFHYIVLQLKSKIEEYQVSYQAVR